MSPIRRITAPRGRITIHGNESPAHVRSRLGPCLKFEHHEPIDRESECGVSNKWIALPERSSLSQSLLRWRRLPALAFTEPFSRCRCERLRSEVCLRLSPFAT